MNQASGHITDAQIQDYVTASRTPPDAHQWLDAHLEDCESCLGRLLQVERIHLGLLEGDAMKGTPYPGCPAEETLQELAAGICAPDTAERTVQHAAHCDYCGPLLGLYLKELSDDVPGEEAALLSQLETTTPKWQKSFIRTHLVTEAPQTGSIFSLVWSGLWSGFWPRLATATAGIAVAVGGYFLLIPPDDLSQAQKLVAAAYGERRTTEMRLTSVPYARYDPLPVERGTEVSPGTEYERPALLKAKGVLADKLRSDVKPNPQWLEVEGRIALFEGAPGSAADAEKAFEAARAGGFDSPRLEIDLAASYFEHDSKVENPNLLRTINLLTRVLKNPKLGPDDRATALFDLAIAYEKSELWNLAVPEWQEYLRTSPGGPWAIEATKHLEDAKKKLPQPRQQGFKEPANFLQTSSTPDVQNYIEPYQDFALSAWLPNAIENPSSDAAKAVEQLSYLMQQQHSDMWWRDFLKGLGPDDLAAVQALSAAFIANANALPQEALQESGKATKWFTQHGNTAGELRALFEEVYALQRANESTACRSRAEELSRKLVGTQYHWLQAQAALEEATCANWASDYKTVDTNVALSREITEHFRFPELNLRITGLDASMKRQQKKYDEAWREAVAGLRSYWQGSYSPERLYQFYAAMYLCANETHFSYASRALMLEAMAIRESNSPDNLTLKTVLYLDIANELRRQGEVTRADDMSAKAFSLLKQIPAREQSAQRAASVTQIELAELVLQDGHADLALAKMSSIRELLQMQDDFVNLNFYRALGNIHRQLHNSDAAVSAYEKALTIAERSLKQMRDDASRVLWIRASDETYRGLTQTLLETKEDRKALVAWERFKSHSLEMRDEGEHGRPADKRTEVPIDSLPTVSEPHLIYATFKDSLHVWLVNGAVIKSYSSPVKQADLEQQIREFVENCANPHSPLDKLHQQAETLYKLLLQPVAGELPSTPTLAIELDQPLAKLTMEALRSSDGSYFGDAYSIIYSPGLHVENTLRLPTPLHSPDSFLLVDASPVNGNGNLPGHEIEQDSVSHTFPRRILITASDLTLPKIKQALRNSVGFDFIGHAKPDGTGTALVLNSNLSLRAADFSPDVMPKLQFAVLSACSSGSAQNGLLDNGSLVRAFLAARVPHIIASQWNVDSESTAQLMKTFYTRLAQGESIASAFHDARIQMRMARNHPYYWAAFSLNGRIS